MANKKKLPKQQEAIVYQLYWWLKRKTTFSQREIEKNLSQLFGVSESPIRNYAHPF